MLSNSIFFTVKNTLNRFREYILFFLFIISSISLFLLANIFQTAFSNAMNIASYLTWHNLFEFASILVCFTVFFISYFTYDQTANLRSAFIGSFLLITGIIDTFHTLSYKGMADFFIQNTNSNRATTFWIISRIITSMGFVIASFIPAYKKSQFKKWIFLYPSLIISFIVLILTTYYPSIFPVMYKEGIGITNIKIKLEIIAIILFMIAIINFLFEYKKSKDPLKIMLSAALFLNVFGEIAFIEYSNINDIYNYLGHLYKVVAFFIIFRIMFIKDVKKPYIELSNAKSEIKDYAENLDKIVVSKTETLMRANQKHLENLRYARDIQTAILPSALPQEDNVKFCARYFPADSVSGDFYNVFKLDENNIGIYLGDVSGHGVPAAMLMVFLNQSIKSLREIGANAFEIIKPSEVLKNLYTSFNKTNFKDDIYAVLLYGIYNIATGELTYSSAGLNVQPIIIKASGEIIELSINGFPICKFIELYDSKYEDNTLSLEYGDKMFFYTDGLIDAENQTGANFSEDRLKNILHRNAKLQCSELADTIETEVYSFLGDSTLLDDISFIIMEVDG